MSPVLLGMERSVLLTAAGLPGALGLLAVSPLAAVTELKLALAPALTQLRLMAELIVLAHLRKLNLAVRRRVSTQ